MTWCVVSYFTTEEGVEENFHTFPNRIARDAFLDAKADDDRYSFEIYKRWTRR